MKHYTTTVGPIEITVAPPAYPPWHVDVIVEEQDTHLLLEGTHIITDTEESYPALIDKMRTRKALVPGRVLVKNTVPRIFIAVVYDIARRPVYREEWIAAALEQLFREMERYHARTVAMPLLGARHGRYLATDFMELFYSRLPAEHADYPEKIWLVTPGPDCGHIIACLEDMHRKNRRM